MSDFTEIAKPFSFLNPGALDRNRGPYPTLVKACEAIPNVTKKINGIDRNLREGKFVDIGTKAPYTTYWWKDGYEDKHLVEHFGEKLNKSAIVHRATSNQKFDKNIYFSDKYIDGSGQLVDSLGTPLTTPVYPIYDAQYITVSGMNRKGNKRVKFFLSGGSIELYEFPDEIKTYPVPAGATHVQVYFRVTSDSDATVLNRFNLNFSDRVLPPDTFKAKIYSVDGYIIPDSSSDVELLKGASLVNIFDATTMIVSGSFGSTGNTLLPSSNGSKMIVIYGSEGDKVFVRRKKALSNRFRYAFTATSPIATGQALLGGDRDSGLYDDAALSLDIVFPANAKTLVIYVQSGTGGDLSNVEIFMRKLKADQAPADPEVTLIKDIYLKNIFNDVNMVLSGAFSVSNTITSPSSSGSKIIVVPGKEGDRIIITRPEAKTNRFRYGFTNTSPVVDGDAITDRNMDFDDAGLKIDAIFPKNTKSFVLAIQSGAGGDISNIKIYKIESQSKQETPIQPGYTPTGKYLFGSFNTLYITPPQQDASPGTAINLAGMTSAGLYAMYDALMSEFPDIITRNIIGYGGTAANVADINLPIYEYVVQSTYLPPVGTIAVDEEMRLNEPPLILLLCSVHGDEKTPGYGTALFLRQLLTGWKTNASLASIKDNVRFKIVPTGNPGGFTANQRYTLSGKDINRLNNPCIERTAIENWITANRDAFLFLDYHNAFYGGVKMGYMTSSNELQREIISTIGRRLSPVWKDKYLNVSDNYTRIYYLVNNLTGLIRQYADSSGIKRCSTIEVSKCFPNQTAANWYKAINIEITIDMLANFLLANLDAYSRQ